MSGAGEGPDPLDPSTPYVPLSAEGPVADTPLWLSHHFPDDYDRCAVVAGRHVCRRCLWMYPTACVAAVLVGVVGPWPAWLVPVLPFPAVVDFVVDNLGLRPYSARRQAVLSAVGAVGAGVGYVRYLDRPGDPLVWGTVLAYGAICLASAVVGWRRRRETVRSEA